MDNPADLLGKQDPPKVGDGAAATSSSNGGGDGSDADGGNVSLEQAIEQAPPEVWDTVWEIIPQAARDKIMSPLIDREAQSRADRLEARRESEYRLDQDVGAITGDIGKELGPILQPYEGEEADAGVKNALKEQRRLLTRMFDRIRVRELQFALRSQPVWGDVGEKMEDVFDSVKTQQFRDQARKIMTAFVEAVQEHAKKTIPADAEKQADRNKGNLELAAKVLGMVLQARGQTPSADINRDGGEKPRVGPNASPEELFAAAQENLNAMKGKGG